MAAIVVCFEGIDGSGKTTQWHRIAERLETAGYAVAKLKAVSRESLFFTYLEPMAYVIDRGTFCNIVAFNRYVEIERMIAQLHDNYDVLLFDRYLLTDFSYTPGFGCTTEFIEELLRRVTSPDLVVLSEVAIDVAMERIGKRVSVLEFQENVEVLSRTALQYQQRRVDGWRTLVVNGSEDVDSVTNLIYTRIIELLALPPTTCPPHLTPAPPPRRQARQPDLPLPQNGNLDQKPGS